MSIEGERKVRGWVLLGAGILAASILGLIIYVIITVVTQTSVSEVQAIPEMFLPVTLIAVVTGLICALTVVSVILAALNLSDRTQALGLPEGSVRALIALSLIFIFAILAIFLYKGLGRATEDQVMFAQQILTTVATLVVAVAGFYFGTKAVQTAKGVVEEKPTLNINYASPVDLNLNVQNELLIKVETTPRNEAISWKIDDEKKGSITPIKPNEFRYKAHEKDKIADKTVVTLTFGLVKYPSITKELEVNIINPPPEKPNEKKEKNV
jgi:uncharacterized membrane protein